MRILIIFCLIFLVNCTKKDQQNANEMMVFKTGDNQNHAAKYKDVFITYAKAYDFKDPVLIDLEHKKYQILLEKLVLYLYKNKEQLDGDTVIVYGISPKYNIGPQVEKYKKFMSINFDFQPEAMPPGETPGFASVGEFVITEEMLGVDDLKMLAIDERVFDYKLTKIQERLIRHIEIDEAKRLKISRVSLRQKTVRENLIYDDQIFEAELKKAGILSDAKNNEKLRMRLRDSFEEAATNKVLLEWSLKTLKKPVEIYLEKPKANLELRDDWVVYKGSDQPKVQILAFNDFYCTACRQLSQILEASLKKYKTGLQVGYYLMFPESDRRSLEAAQMSYCLKEQNEDYFWQLNSLLVTKGDKLSEGQLYTVGQELGADEEALKNCFVSQRYKSGVDYLLAYGKYLGITSIPTIYVNGRAVSGNITQAKIDQLVGEYITAEKLSWWRRTWNWLTAWF